MLYQEQDYTNTPKHRVETYGLNIWSETLTLIQGLVNNLRTDEQATECKMLGLILRNHVPNE